MRSQTLLLVAWAGFVAGCQTTTAPREPPAPSLQLLGSSELWIPDDCAVVSGRIYRTSFRVGVDGRTLAVAPDVRAPDCLRDALAQWVGSFHYVPPRDVTTSAIDWLRVTARRGS